MRFFCDYVSMYLIHDQRQLFFFQCGTEMPKSWTPLQSEAQKSVLISPSADSNPHSNLGPTNVDFHLISIYAFTYGIHTLSGLFSVSFMVWSSSPESKSSIFDQAGEEPLPWLCKLDSYCF